MAFFEVQIGYGDGIRYLQFPERLGRLKGGSGIPFQPVQTTPRRLETYRSA